MMTNAVSEWLPTLTRSRHRVGYIVFDALGVSEQGVALGFVDGALDVDVMRLPFALKLSE
jgi:hypothetical protein